MPGQKASEAIRREQIILAAYAVAAQKGLRGLTVRQVSAEARLSTGLVFWHFETKGQLLLALLDWLLETTTVLQIGPEIEALATPLERLLALLRQEMNRLAREPQRIQLFFEFWVLGGRDVTVGKKMRAELARYRRAFRPMAAEVLEAEPDRFPHVTAEGLAGVAVSFIKGCAVQAMLDPHSFDIREHLTAAEGLLGQLAPSGRGRSVQRWSESIGQRHPRPRARRSP